ncbi:winged helix-turn-helix domain-containing protein [Citrobacter farmeri]|uniref:winged helix-turn-helix domain-containing protein n=1 Tax=Citrobacter amalonaticus TaxID=35703 RepID=UPI00069C570E|nr:winged helix-turn-helix domain-containing protein [Citrobacter amalonaticus]EKV5652705.1 winged helix-turn-helix domain-containing protein [Citrobacter farmeri]
MPNRYILDDLIEFLPDKYQLVSRHSSNLAITLNVPASRCLQLLLERRHDLVPQNDFYPYVWGDEGASVPVSTLYQNISLLRKALKTFSEDGDKIIQTVPKKGFLLAKDVNVQEIDLTDDVDEVESALPEIPHSTAQQSSTTAEKSVFKNQYPLKLFFLISVLVLSIAAGLQLFLWGLPTALNDIYTQKMNISGCSVHTNYKFTTTEVSKQINDNNIDCKQTPYVYLYTASLQFNIHSSLLLCKHPLESDLPFDCTTYNILGDAAR